jgi:hypothetical protein
MHVILAVAATLVTLFWGIILLWATWSTLGSVQYALASRRTIYRLGAWRVVKGNLRELLTGVLVAGLCIGALDALLHFL